MDLYIKGHSLKGNAMGMERKCGLSQLLNPIKDLGLKEKWKEKENSYWKKGKYTLEISKMAFLMALVSENGKTEITTKASMLMDTNKEKEC